MISLLPAISKANLVLQDTVERTYVGDSYGEVYRGIFVIRGENVVLLGEIDKEKEAAAIGMLRQLPVEEIKDLHKREMDVKRKTDKARSRVLQERGFSVDGQEQNDQY
ncbi:hypothetical protein SpCBS45565_g07513 [Spizellomyces sp. 'palustris']|nr:hypothetical protein SpCBS45565_g07513 [Spizellomyces sp. 'palustris']